MAIHLYQNPKQSQESFNIETDVWFTRLKPAEPRMDRGAGDRPVWERLKPQAQQKNSLTQDLE